MDDIYEILQYLKENSKGDEEEFTIWGSNPVGWIYHYSFITQNDTSQYVSYIQKDAFLVIEFLHHQVEIHGYRINNRQNCVCFLNSWILSGSNDQIIWTLLDERRYDSSLEQINFTTPSDPQNDDLGNQHQDNNHGIIDFQIFPQGNFKYIKLQQTGKNNKGVYQLAIRYFDLIGKLV